MQRKTARRLANVLLVAGLATLVVHTIGFWWFNEAMQRAQVQVVNQMFLAFAAIGVAGVIYTQGNKCPEWLRSVAIAATCFGTPFVFILL